MSLFDALGPKGRLPAPREVLSGRDEPIPTAATHQISGRPLAGPYPEGSLGLLVGMGCFWGAERIFWQLDGVWVTAVGYAGGQTPNPTYEEVCTGTTGHAEVVKVVFKPSRIPLERLLSVFWEGHDPTQGMRQGNDVGTQYRSALYLPGDEALAVARASRDAYQAALTAGGLGPITTEIAPMPVFYFAEGYHQQYLAKNPNGYCGIGGTGVACPAGLGA
ncbi:peptide-methionine (S)-S-oxide reductase [Breoghania corrubedonensis]|uniref:Peptide methionine sulfoxide reductase MsrA n=1 Tax=Breoghania corrubedonensis TaxID=665038 RepID=A0A2T5VFM4_9HYPH|nr:peptide-methionine (S)-S-oxide reductase MsrA [Breoghania corrubedonensis]PTW62557.1 peptide-methionine (S)-S-oxide reductase [Breoghania corrubedonensis]